ncbi:MAG TPA: hypothetical protein VJ810_07325 [Blastocatellia bacterium]|nr:hypothetical protein [Blastocatellia bacterium]
MRRSSQLFYAFLTAIAFAASLTFFATDTFAQTVQRSDGLPGTETTEPDTTFGPDGKKITVRDKNGKIIKVVLKDSQGRKRQEQQIHYIGDEKRTITEDFLADGTKTRIEYEIKDGLTEKPIEKTVHVMDPKTKEIVEGSKELWLNGKRWTAKWNLEKHDFDDFASAAVGRQRIEVYLAYIESRIARMKSIYYYGNAVKTLEAAFDNNGVSSKAMPYAVEWGNNGVYLAWDSASKFYAYHYNALKESLNAIRPQSAAGQSDLANIYKGMGEWIRIERQLQERFQTLVAVYTGRAVNAGKRFAVSDKYSALRAEASKQRNSDRVNALNIEEAEVMKPLDIERRRLEAQQDSERQGIDEIAARRLFEALKPRAASRR